MSYKTSYKKTIFTGTLILTLSGFLARILGFYNRIFLSNLIGAKELGIYVVPMPFMIDGKDYLEEINLTQEEFY